MKQPDFKTRSLSAYRIAIWGLGLIGGSLALGLKGKCAEVVGIDHDQRVVDYALSNEIVQQASISPEELLEKADIIILATPVRTILRLLDALPALCQRPVIVIDLGSTKREILLKMLSLPERFDVVGGHPMCGKEKGTIWNADAAIFQKATIAFTKTQRSSQCAVAAANQVAQWVGSTPFWVDAEAHDRWVSATSHVPYLLANALVQSTPVDASPLVGPGFRSTARVAANPASMMVDVLATNRDNILMGLQSIRENLTWVEEMLEREEYQELTRQLMENAQRYHSILQEGSENADHNPPWPPVAR